VSVAVASIGRIKDAAYAWRGQGRGRSSEASAAVTGAGERSAKDAAVIVVGAGPSGLATAAELRRGGVSAVVGEGASGVAASWHRHYERLRLHTARELSHLPGLRIPSSEGRWVSRDGVVRYLDAYARHHQLQIRFGVEVTRITRADGRWCLRTSVG